MTDEIDPTWWSTLCVTVLNATVAITIKQPHYYPIDLELQWRGRKVLSNKYLTTFRENRIGSTDFKAKVLKLMGYTA